MKRILVILIGLLVASCTSKLEKPTPFFEEQKVEDILFDMALLYSIEGVSAYSRADTLKRLTVSSVFNKHGVDSVSFVANNRYYVELEKGVYTRIQNNILKRIEAQKQLVDSLADAAELEVKAIEEKLNLESIKLDDTLQLKLKKIDNLQSQNQ